MDRDDESTIGGSVLELEERFREEMPQADAIMDAIAATDAAIVAAEEYVAAFTAVPELTVSTGTAAAFFKV